METNDLKNAIIQRIDNELIDFINQNFYENQNEEKFSNNMIAIKELDSVIINHGISRMKKIEESNDFAKNASVAVTFLLSILAIFSVYTTKVFDSIKDFIDPVIINLLIMLLFFITMALLIYNSRKNRSLAAYFKSLLQLYKN